MMTVSIEYLITEIIFLLFITGVGILFPKGPDSKYIF